MSATQGSWGPVEPILIPNPTVSDGTGADYEDSRGLFVVHAVMLCTGKVLWFCGHVESGHYALLSYVFDPKNPTQQLRPIPFPRHNPTLARSGPTDHPADSGTGPHADLFCSHYVQIQDGRILLVGGSDPDTRDNDSLGEKYIYMFDPIDERWEVSFTCSTPNRLNQGRWYPTAVLMGDGRVLVASGRREFSFFPGRPAGIADQVEILTPPNYAASVLKDAEVDLPIYPGLHLAENGRIYYTHTNWRQEITAPPNTLSIEVPPGADSATWTDHAGRRPASTRREEGMSVLLPPANDGKILLFGGGLADPDVLPPDSVLSDAIDPRRAEVLDTKTAQPTWTSLPNMTFGRINGHGVILPDSTVLILGGHNNYKWRSIANGTTPSFESEIFDPATNTFQEVAKMTEPRMYHSAAVLLPDGRVIVAGGADGNHFEPVPPYPLGWQGPRYGSTMPFNRKDYEIYEPPYFFYPGSRPEITRLLRNGGWTTQIQYGEELVIESPEAGSIEKVGLMRPCCPTHHTDSEQRYVELDFTQDSDAITATISTNRNLAPPGWYMVWILDIASNGKLRPCAEARWVQLTGPPLAGPAPSSGGPCVVVTAAMGSQVADEVVFLRGLREEVRQSGAAGRRFIEIVNAIYSGIGPPIASRMRRHPNLRAAIRALLVQPSVALISATAAFAQSAFSKQQTRYAVLIALLAGEGAVGLIFSPLLVTLVMAWSLLASEDDADG